MKTDLSSPVATAEFSKFAGILSATLSLHHLSGFKTAQLEFHHFHFHAVEKEMATHSSVLALRIPGTAEPGGLPSMGSHRVGHD